MKNFQDSFVQGIGNTPLIKLKAASEVTGCNIYGKAEFLNPGGSVKDRAALALIKDAEEKKLISKGGTIVEGTAGNTGIGLCLIGNSIGYKTVIVLNYNQKQNQMMKTAFAATLAVVIQATQLQTKAGDLMMNELDFSQLEDRREASGDMGEADFCFAKGGDWVEGECFMEEGLAQIESEKDAEMRGVVLKLEA